MGLGGYRNTPLTIPDTPSLLLLTAHFWYYNFRLSGSSSRRTQLLISDFPLKRFSEKKLKTDPKAVRSLVSPLFVDCPSTEMYKPLLNPKKEHPPPHSLFLQLGMRIQVSTLMCLRQRGRRMHTSRSCTCYEKHTL